MGETDAIADRGVSQILPFADAYLDEILTFCTSQPSLEAADDSLFSLLESETGGEMTESIYQSIMIGAMLGALEFSVDEKGVALADATYSNLPFNEAVEYFKSRKIVDSKTFYEMDATARRRAFTISGDIQRYDLANAHELLQQAIGEGLSEREFRAAFNDSSPLWGTSKRGKAHLDTVFRNNVLSAFSEGKYQQQSQLKKQRPFWQYRTMEDDAVRPAHAAMNGKVFAADDPIWSEWYPPNGHRCRCKVVTYSRSELQDEGLDVQTRLPTIEGKPVTPDPGWDGSPASKSRAVDTARAAEAKFNAEAALLGPQSKPAQIGKQGSVIAGADALTRKNEAKRIAAVDKLAKLKPAQIETALADHGHFTIEPGGVTKLKRGEMIVEVPFYSQDSESAKGAIEQMASTPEGLKLAQVATFKARAAFTKTDSRIWSDLQIARPEMGPGQQARAAEVLIQVRPKTTGAESLARAFAEQSQSGGPAATRDSWIVGGARIRGAVGKPPPGWREAWLNTRKAGSGDMSILTREKKPGWKSERVFVSDLAYELLP